MKFVTTVLIAFFASYQAQAEILFEPMVSYEAGANHIEYTTAGEVLKGTEVEKSTNSAVSYGGRLGLIFKNGFWMAGRYSAATSGKAKYDGHEDTYERSAMGADLGMWSGRWNVWLGYDFTDKLDFTRGNATEKSGVSGTAARFGLGFMLYSHIAFNLEYTYHMYTKGATDSIDGAFAQFDNNVSAFTQQGYSAGLSFPF